VVLVIGAGLAGLTYAHRAVRNGEKVEVWEKDHTLGLKPCGEAVLDGALEHLPLSAREKSGATLNHIRRVRLRFPSEGGLPERVISVNSGGDAVIVDKPSLLETLAEVVESEGAQILRGKLFMREQAVRLDAVDMIVDASGFVRATHVGEGVVAPVLRGYHGRTGIINSDELFVEFDADGMGYFWIFPYGDNYNVGFGGLYSPSTLRAKLQHYLTKYGLNDAYDVRGAGIVVSGPLKQWWGYLYGRPVIRIGESGGVVNPLLGEGNREAILDALGQKDIRERVERATNMFKAVEHVGSQAYKLASRLSDRELEDVLEGRRVPWRLRLSLFLLSPHGSTARSNTVHVEVA
jgi:digeranylgeranylglycerophospholipid reductase